LALGDLSAAGNAVSTAKELRPKNSAILPEFQKLAVVKWFLEEGNKAHQQED
jgi:hypothetical protein